MTRGELVASVLKRMGDPSGAIWTRAEVVVALQNGLQDLATGMDLFYDWTYLENLPNGANVTQPWEAKLIADTPGWFLYGIANYTADFERDMVTDARTLSRDPANHTSPFEATDGFLSAVHASTNIPATADLPAGITSLHRASWDNRGIDAVSPRLLQQTDARYELTKGEVYGYTWRHDGVRTFRKVRVPAAMADTVTVNGSWGLCRQVSGVASAGGTATGTWGIPRRIPGHHPMGPEQFGTPRRFYLEGKNVRVEHFRLAASLDADNTACELPDRYALYLRDFAQMRLLARAGPGQDLALSAHFAQRWARDKTLIASRIDRVYQERVSVLGGSGAALTTRPPRPRLPWAYGRSV